MPLPLSLINLTPDIINVTDLGLLLPPGSGTILNITGLYLVEELRDSVSLATLTVTSGIVLISGSEGVLNATQAFRFFQGSQIAEQNFTTEGIDLRELRNTAVLAGANIVVTSGEDFAGFRTFTVSTDDNVITDALVGAGNVSVVSGTNIITISGSAIGIANRQVLCRIGGPFAEGTVLDLFDPGPGWQVEGDQVSFSSAEDFVRSLQIYRNGQLLFPGTTVTGLNDVYFVAASGSLAFQSPIITNDIVQIWEFAIGPDVTAGQVTDVNDISGSIDLVGAGEVFITTVGQTITVSGTPHITDTDIDTVSDALIGVDGITIISGTNITTVSGFRDEFVNASGSLQIQIDNFTVSSGVSSVNTLGGDIDIIGKDQVSVTTEGQTIVVSGLPTDPDVDSINTVTGTVTVEGSGEVFVTTVGQTITISGTPHPADKDTVSDAIIGGVGITVTSGSNITTIDGHLRYTSAENDAIVGAGEVVVISGTNIITISGTPHPADKDTVSDALVGVDGITVLSGTSITTISGFRSEFVSSSGSLQEQIDAIESGEPAIIGGIGITVTSGVDTTTIDGHLRYTSAENDAIIGIGEVVVTSGSGVIVISGTPHPADKDTVSDAIIGGVGITVTSGVDTTTIDGHLRYTQDENDAILGGVGITVTSGVDSITIDGHERYTSAENDAIVGAGEVVVISGAGVVVISGTPHEENTDTVSDAIIGVDGITVLSGTSITTISGFRTEFVSASGSLQVQIDNITVASGVSSVNTLGGDIEIEGAGKVFVSTAGQTITVSGLPDDLDVDAIVVSGVQFTGVVTLSGVGGVKVAPHETDPQVITISGEPPPTTSGGQVIDENFLTINRVRVGFGKDGNVNGAYLRVEGVSSNNTGHVMIRAAQLTGIAAYYDGGASEKFFSIRKNGDTTDLATFKLFREVAFTDESFPVALNFETGDRVQVFVSSSGTSIRDPNVWLEIGWRADS